MEKKDEETHLSACESSLEHADVTSVVHEEAEEKMEEQLHVWIRGMLTEFFLFVCLFFM